MDALMHYLLHEMDWEISSVFGSGRIAVNKEDTTTGTHATIYPRPKLWSTRRSEPMRNTTRDEA